MLRGRLTYSNVMSTIAVLGILAGGTAFAAKKITARQIANSAVKTSKIKNGAVTTVKLANQAVKAGKLGTVVTRFGTEPLPDDGTLHSAAAQCATGEKLIGGGANFDPTAGSDTPLIASRPATDAAGGSPSNGGSFNTWRATAINVPGGTGATSIHAWAICLK
jgi:hypothetical protein